MSDKIGRIPSLYIGTIAYLSSYIINIRMNSIAGMWISLVPSSLLNQNYSVLKALFSDYKADGTESDRASVMGQLGMTVGIAFMIGPTLGATVLSNYEQAMMAAIALVVISGCILRFIPESSTRKEIQPKNPSFTNNFLSFLSLPAAQSTGAKLLFFMRCFMGLAYHIFMVVWTVSLKERFSFGPKDHAFFMGWVGLCYAVSQGIFAKLLIRQAGEDPTTVLMMCLLVLGGGRVFAMLTSSIVAVYIIMAFVILALGVVNTVMSSACSRLADKSEVGGLFGIMEAIESFSGLIGPTLGGILNKLGPNVPLVSVIAIYLAIFFVVKQLFFKHIIEYDISNHDLKKDIQIEKED
jgi:MFS family permease